MKVLQYTLLASGDKSIYSEFLEAPHFYPHLHRHKEYQITWIQEGEGTLIAGKSMHDFQSGDVFLIGADLPHLFKSNPEYFFLDKAKMIKSYSVYFNTEGLMSSLFDLPEMKNAKSFLQQNRYGFKVAAKDAKQISERVLSIHKSSGMNLIFKFIELLNDFNEMKGFDSLCSATYGRNISENEGVRLSNILNFIMKNYNNQITLEDISEVAYLTPQAFCRYFKKHTGRKFISFLNEVRINEACKNLVTAKQAECISGVAYNSGFNSITNFNRVFKSFIGSSPKDYINSYNRLNNISYVGIN